MRPAMLAGCISPVSTTFAEASARTVDGQGQQWQPANEGIALPDPTDDDNFRFDAGEVDASPSPLRQAYSRKVSQVRMAPCAHIAAVIHADHNKLGGAAGLFEHHAVLDISAQEVIHYSRDNHTDHNRVLVETLADFERSYYPWRIIELPASVEHAQVVIERARSQVGEDKYAVVSNNCEHFASWCFDGCASSKQVWAMGANVASSAKGGVAVGLAAATATTTVTTPWYFMGMVQWGTTTATVPAMSTGAAVGVGAAAFVGWIGVGLGMSYGMHKWVEHRNGEVSQLVPICIFNCSDDEALFQLENLEASSSFYSPGVDDLVHDTRAWCGIGQRKLILGAGIAGELNPPAEDELFHRFLLRVFIKDVASSTISSYWPSYTEICTTEVRRGDVLIYRESELTQIRDPADSSLA